jgi:hypothetical protein
MSDDLETRLRAAIHAEADAVDDVPHRGAADTSLPAIRSRVRTVRRRRRVLAAAAAVAVVVVGIATLPRLGDDPADVDTFGPASEDRTTTPTTAAPSTDATSGTGVDTAGGSTTTAPPDEEENEDEGAAPDAIDPTGPDVLGDGFQPLWPFPTRAAAAEWQQAYRDGGQQPWHLEAEQTALSFTTGFLGFTEIDQVTSSDVRPTEAWIGVGSTDPGGGGTSTAAVIHLLRWDTSESSPWEVVGTRDTTLRLETPDYATTARSPMTVGGFITGVDESVRVQVRQASTSGPLGETPEGVAAGGEDAPWETTVAFSGATDPAVTVVAWSGGHVQEVEIFAITGLRTPTR